MILIIGGAYQGKGEFARQLSGLDQEEFDRRSFDGCGPDGRTGAVPEAGKEIFLNYHGFVRRLLDRGEDVEAVTR